jgi:ABC-type phosphate transport system permease subunit
MNTYKNDLGNTKYQNKKALKNQGFKVSLILTVSIVLFFFLTIIAFLAFNGISGFFKFADLNASYFFTGQYYDLYNGVLPGGLLVVNTMWTAMLAVMFAVPVSVLTALFITRVAPKKLRPLLFSLIVLLASVPSIIYGSFGLGFIDNIMNGAFGVQGAIISIVTTLAIMITPTITLITVTSINNVDKKMENSSLALGATRMQTNFHVTLKAVTTGILTGTILGVGRALGEASAVSMVAAESSTIPSFGLFNHTRLLTTSMLKGFSEVTEGSVEQSYMFALGLILMITVLFVFGSLKKIQKQTDPQFKSRKQSLKANELDGVYSLIEGGKSLESLSIREQKIYKETEIINLFSKSQNIYFEKKITQSSFLAKSSIKLNNEQKKLKQSKALGTLT